MMFSCPLTWFRENDEWVSMQRRFLISACEMVAKDLTVGTPFILVKIVGGSLSQSVESKCGLFL